MEGVFIDSAQMINNVFKNISLGAMEESNKVFSAWQTTVSKISGNGEQLAAHSHVVDLKNGILLIETDHPGWSQMLQMHKKFILTGMNRLSGGVKIESLAFRVSGSNARLTDHEEIARKAVERYTKKLEEEEAELQKRGFLSQRAAADSGAGKDLPPELNEIFLRLKKSAEKNS